MNLKATWPAFLSFLKINKEDAENTELSAERLDSLHGEFNRLKSEHTSLVEAKKDVDEKFASSVTEIKTLKSSIESKDQEILQLKMKVPRRMMKSPNLKNR